MSAKCPLQVLRDLRDRYAALLCLQWQMCLSWAQVSFDRGSAMSESSDNPFLSDSDEPSPAPAPPGTRPVGPPPPQNMTSLRLSQQIADALNFTGPVLTRIDPSTYEATGLVVTIQEWTPGDQLARDVIWCGTDDPPPLMDGTREAADANANAEATRVAEDISRQMSMESRQRMTTAEMDAILAYLPEGGPAELGVTTSTAPTMASSSASGRNRTSMEAEHPEGADPETHRNDQPQAKAKAKARAKDGGTKRWGVPNICCHADWVRIYRYSIPVLVVWAVLHCLGAEATRICEPVESRLGRTSGLIGPLLHSFWCALCHLIPWQLAQCTESLQWKMEWTDPECKFLMFMFYALTQLTSLSKYLEHCMNHWLARYNTPNYENKAGSVVCSLYSSGFRLWRFILTSLAVWNRWPNTTCRQLALFDQAWVTSLAEQLKYQMQRLQGFLSELDWAGPNSGRRLGRRHHSTTLMVIICLLCVQQSAGTVDARVAAGATPASEITELVSVVKPSGMRRASEPQTIETPRHVKRSYMRARARALRQGGAWYKGFWRGAKWFESGPLRTQGISRRQKLQSEPRAWNVVTWNASGLTVATFQELETLLRRDKIDIAFIQESKWKFESTWENAEYLYVHTCGTGPLDRVGGLLTVVSTKLAKVSNLQFQVLHAGRLLHVRFPCGSVHADLINCYQYAVGQDEQTYDRRHKWFIKLHKCLAGLPKRNVLVMGGDYNTPCIPHKGVCGPMVTTHAAAQYKDCQDWQNILRTMNLTVLNTWCRPVHGQLATFSTFGGERVSQIDFLIVRSRHAAREAKQAQALPDFPVAAWREGHKHFPVQAWISKLSPPWHQANAVQQAVKVDTEAIISDLKQQQESAQLRALRDEVRLHVTADPEKLSNVLMQAAQHHYPMKRVAARPLSQPEALANSAKDMWALFRRMRDQQFSMAGVIQAWRCWVDFQRAHTLHKQRSRQRSKQRKTDIIDAAQQAANEGNAYKVWQAVQKLVPKAPRKQLQLHKNGAMMTFREELDWILEAYGKRYGEQAQTELVAVSQGTKEHGTFAIDATALEAQLAKLNPRKAVPKGTTPAVVWKACSQIVAGPVAAQFNHIWQADNPCVCQSWADAEVALLPKAHGRSATPEDWRPIGLQDPLGKCVMGLVVAQARAAIVQLVMRYPQCAYLPGRSTTTALKQVFRHCFDVRRECERTRVTIHQQHQGQRSVQCTGGLQISLDLSAAFDVVHWSHLKAALDQAGVNILVQEVIITWLTQVRYLFNRRGHQGVVKPKWGLRQGCKASPCLWAAYTALLCATLDHELAEQHVHMPHLDPSPWTRQHITKYADDTHARWRFTTYQEFEGVMQEVLVMLRCFRRFHMRVNLEKTKAVLKVVGSLKHRVKQNFIRKFKDSRRLLLSPKNPDHWLTLVSSTEYLGAVVSYDQYELQTMRHRIQKANNRRWALASFLHSRRISISLKLRIWRSCVLTTLMYGMASCGLTGDALLEVQRAIMRHVRAIVSNQAHLTGDTHQAIVTKYNIPSAKDLCEIEYQRAQDRQQSSPDWMFDEQWHLHLWRRLHQTTEQSEQPNDRACWACPACDGIFPTQAALKWHARRMHNIVDNEVVFNKALHSKGGLPVCRFCDTAFSRWQTLADHITKRRCQKLPEHSDKGQDSQFCNIAATTNQACNKVDSTENSNAQQAMDVLHQSLVQETSVRQHAARGLNACIQLPHVLMKLKQTCALCGQWVASHRNMKRHYQYSHADVLDAFGERIEKQVSRVATACPTCHYCHARVKDWKAHLKQCVVAWQCSVLCLIIQDGPDRAGRVLRLTQAASGAEQAPEISRPTVGAPEKPPRQRQLGAYFGKSSGEAGGGDQDLKTGSLDSYVDETRRGKHPAPSLPSCQSVQAKVAGEPPVEPRPKTAENGASNRCVSRARGKTSKGPQQRRSAQEGFRYGMEGCEHRMGVSTLESHPKVPGKGPSQDPSFRPDAVADLNGPATIPGRGHGDEVCIRKLTETMQGVATFLMDISVRSQAAQESWTHILSLQGNTVLQLIGLAYRRETLQCGPMVNQLKEMIRGR